MSEDPIRFNNGEAYLDATEKGFGADVDYGQAVTFYDMTPRWSGAV